MRTANRAGWLALLAIAGCAPVDPEAASRVDVSVGTAAAVEKVLNDARGKPVLVDFWATWCGPCVRKYPSLVKLHDTYAPQGLVVMGVSFDKPEDAEQVRDFLARQKATFPNTIVPTRTRDDLQYLAERFGYAGGIPHVVLFDRAGRRVWDSAADGPNDFELEQRIRSELAKPAP